LVFDERAAMLSLNDVQADLLSGNSTPAVRAFLGQGSGRAFKDLDFFQPFDLKLRYEHPAFKSAVKKLTSELKAETGAARGKQRSNLERHVWTIASNLTHAYLRPQKRPPEAIRWVACPRGKNDERFGRHKQDVNPFGLTVTGLSSTVDALFEAGWIDYEPGFYFGPGQSAYSKIRLMPPLTQRLADAGALDLEAIRAPKPDKPVVVLGRSAKASCPPVAVVRHNHRVLTAFNALLATAHITFATNNDATVIREIALAGVNPHRKQVWRVFHEKDFASRIGWAFWQNLPKRLRPLLRIDGEAVAEVDFQAMQLHLLYAMEAANLWWTFAGTDPFDLLETANLGRDIVKLGFNCLTNTETDAEADNALRKKLLDMRIRGWKGSDTKTVIAALKRHHPPIQRHRGKAAAKRLQHLESEVMLAILDHAVRDQVAVLPLHDGLLVPASRAAWAEAAMASAVNETGLSSRPGIKVTSPTSKGSSQS
jgi:hypothetical protein